MTNFTATEMEIIKNAFESKTEVLLDCYGRVTADEELEHRGEICCYFVEVEDADNIEQFMQRIKNAQEDLDEAVNIVANNSFEW